MVLTSSGTSRSKFASKFLGHTEAQTERMRRQFDRPPSACVCSVWPYSVSSDAGSSPLLIFSM